MSEIIKEPGAFSDILTNYVYPGVTSNNNFDDKYYRILKFDGSNSSFNNGVMVSGNTNYKCLHWLKSSITTSGATPYYGFRYPAIKSKPDNNEVAIQRYSVSNVKRSFFTDGEKEALLAINSNESTLESVKDNALCFIDSDGNRIDYVMKVTYLISAPEIYVSPNVWHLQEAANSPVNSDRLIINGTEIIVSQHVSVDGSKLYISKNFVLKYKNLSGTEYTINGDGNTDSRKVIDLTNFNATEYENFRVVVKSTGAIISYVVYEDSEKNISSKSDFDGIYTKQPFTCQFRYFNGNTISGTSVTANMANYSTNGYYDDISEAKLNTSKSAAYLISDGNWHTVYYHFLPGNYVFTNEREKYLYFIRFICKGEYGGRPGYTVYFKEFSVYPNLNAAVSNSGNGYNLLTNTYFENNIVSFNNKIEMLQSQINALETLLRDLGYTN